MHWLWWLMVPVGMLVGWLGGSLLYLVAVWLSENEDRFNLLARQRRWVTAKEKAIEAKAKAHIDGAEHG
ncbi:MAG: hypothetical protein LC792_29925 [Actinobacteria bacterium]|nr:hypothetical protein [Actinomycetota bacterium]